ncbi:hypothetical protein RFI_19880 [Reticulomyxa filosa]|uniref:Uncharacterized protein n=1 Tax=Reticulomyxa filosa TaxID=46433 RepID=X6MUG0_RETFI|nr:hypothetical protein RFI_19880 [Reticulomyxa filosa]|eukprot:ETO17439.1 hypothetical protein RFI_19880 [Reticulomyxa filosa]
MLRWLKRKWYFCHPVEIFVMMLIFFIMGCVGLLIMRHEGSLRSYYVAQVQEDKGNYLLYQNESIGSSWKRAFEIVDSLVSNGDPQLVVLPSVYNSSYFRSIRKYLSYEAAIMESRNLPYNKTSVQNGNNEIVSLLSKVNITIKPHAKRVSKRYPYGHNLYMSHYFESCFNHRMVPSAKRVGYIRPELKNDRVFDNEYNALFRVIDAHAFALPQHVAYQYIAIAGMYNTGTNALYRLMNRNCMGYLTWGYRQTLHQVPWLKHSLVNASIIQSLPWTWKLRFPMLAVVIIKDPLTWIKSTCKARYYIQFSNQSQWYSRHCPKHIHKSILLWHQTVYPSLAHLWNAWSECLYIYMYIYEFVCVCVYEEEGEGITIYVALTFPFFFFFCCCYINLMCIRICKRYSAYFDRQVYEAFPVVIIRFEDLLFQPNSILKLFCEYCVGGRLKKISARQVIELPTKQHGDSRNRTEALHTYSNREYRTSEFTARDLRYLNHLIYFAFLQLFIHCIRTRTTYKKKTFVFSSLLFVSSHKAKNIPFLFNVQSLTTPFFLVFINLAIFFPFIKHKSERKGGGEKKRCVQWQNIGHYCNHKSVPHFRNMRPNLHYHRQRDY